MSAPCAKLMTPVALYVSRKPTAASAAIAPSARPLASNAVKLLTACSRAPGRLPGLRSSRRRSRRGGGRRSQVVVTTVKGNEPGANAMCFAMLSLPAASNFTMSAACDSTWSASDL